MKSRILFCFILVINLSFKSTLYSQCSPGAFFTTAEKWISLEETINNRCGPAQVGFSFNFHRGSTWDFFNNPQVVIVLTYEGAAVTDVRFDNTADLHPYVTSAQEVAIGNSYQLTITIDAPPIAPASFAVDEMLFVFDFIENPGFFGDSSGFNYKIFEVDQNGALIQCTSLSESGQIRNYFVEDDLELINSYSVLPANDFLSGEIQFENTIVVDNDFLIRHSTNPCQASSDNFKLNLMDGAEIIVTNNSTLQIWNYDIVGCAENWSRITVESGSKLELKCCSLINFDEAVVLEDGASLIIDGNTFKANNNDRDVAISVNGTLVDFTSGNNLFENCHIGIRASSSNNLQITPFDDEPNVFFDCETGISFDESSGRIEHNNFVECLNGIDIDRSSGLVTILDNKIGFVATGIVIESSEARIEDNKITGSSSLDNTLQIGVELDKSMVDVVNNHIKSGQIGIDAYACFSSEGNQLEIYENWIDVKASNRQDDLAIYAALSENLLIKNNRLQGSGHRASIRSRYGFFNEISYNTFEADSYENGISLELGYQNMITNNDLQNEPTNAILNFGSTENLFKDNNLSYTNVGLMIARNSDVQTIECNQFNTPGTSLSIASETGIQEFNQNEFGDETRARVLINPSFISRNRFIYDEEKPEHRPEFDLSGLFKDEPAGNNPTACDPFYGSGIPGSPPPDFCEKLMEFSGSQYWIQLRQLLGRYFDTHGPNQLPDCIPDCRMVELTQAEYELRTAKQVSEETGFNEAVSNLRNVVAQQIVHFEEQPLQEEPCEGDEIFELYRDTYVFLLKDINEQILTAEEMIQTIQTAELCVDDYGAPVIWARSILHRHPEHSYIEDECDLGKEVKARTSSDYADLAFYFSPNPSSIQVEITLTGEIESYKSVSLIDSKGHMVLTKTIDQKRIQLNTETLANGLYLITIESAKGETLIEKLVIQH